MPIGLFLRPKTIDVPAPLVELFCFSHWNALDSKRGELSISLCIRCSVQFSLLSQVMSNIRNKSKDTQHTGMSLLGLTASLNNDSEFFSWSKWAEGTTDFVPPAGAVDHISPHLCHCPRSAIRIEDGIINVR